MVLVIYLRDGRAEEGTLVPNAGAHLCTQAADFGYFHACARTQQGGQGLPAHVGKGTGLQAWIDAL